MPNIIFFENVESILKKLSQIYNTIKIFLGPTGKNGILLSKKNEIKLLIKGSFVLSSLNLNESKNMSFLLKIFDQASKKTASISGDSSLTNILFACQLLKSSLGFLLTGYNSIFLSSGLKKIAFFCIEKVIELAKPVKNFDELKNITRTSIGKKIDLDLLKSIENTISCISRDSLIVVEENFFPFNEVTNMKGLELDKGFVSSYFINDFQNFTANYDNPYVLIVPHEINSINQIKNVLDYSNQTKHPLVIICENISKEIISTLVLNNLKKKIQVVVIKYNKIKFFKAGILEDLAILTNAAFFDSLAPKLKLMHNYKKEDLGQASKIIITREKSRFFISKYSKLNAERRINELNRQFLVTETDFEKSNIKTRIARLSGNILKIKVGSLNQYQIQEERQKIENLLITLNACLEEGILPGGGVFYLYLIEELKRWSILNLQGEEQFSTQIAIKALSKPFFELCENTNQKYFLLKNKLENLGYPYSFDFIKKKIIHSFDDGIIDSAKSIRTNLWNSFSLIATLITVY